MRVCTLQNNQLHVLSETSVSKIEEVTFQGNMKQVKNYDD